VSARGAFLRLVVIGYWVDNHCPSRSSSRRQNAIKVPPALPQNFADPGGGVCLKTIPTGGSDDDGATCVETELTQRGVVASEQI
jgi:hypothetical protein